MWILTKHETDENLILLPHKDNYSVGRAGCDVVLKDDLCISRTHAVLHVIKTEIPKLELEDIGSKYGTFHNEGIAANKPIDKNKPLSLQDGDNIRFGVLSNIWHVKTFRIATLASALTRPQNQQLEKAMNALGGQIVDSWSNCCTHLTMNEVSVTVKLLYALLEQLPVVNYNYWIELFKLAKSCMFNGPLPIPEQFAPRHPTDMDIGRRADRQKVFQGKTFVFMNRKHFEVYSPIVTRASGACKDLNTGVKKTFLTKDNVIVIQFVPSSQSQATETINNITGILEQSSLRIIPEYEIGLAIIHCSTEKYCNPKYKLIQDIMPTEEYAEKNLPTCTVFAENTAEEKQSKVTPNTKSEVIVPETEGTNKNTSTSNPKVQPIVIDSEDDEQPVNSCMPSIPITESNAEENSQPRKRKRLTRRRQVLYDTDEEDDDDDEIFQFNKIPKKNVEDDKEEPAKQTRSSARNKQQVSAATNGKTKTSEISDKYKLIQDIMPTEEYAVKNLPTCTVFAENTAEKKQSKVTPNTQSEVIVPETKGTNKNTSTSNPKVQPIVIDSEDDEQPVNSNAEENSHPRKRKRLTRRRQVLYDTDEEDDDDDEIFQFNKIPKKNVEDDKEEPAKQTRSSARNKQQQVSAATNDKTKNSERSENSTVTTLKKTRNETAMEHKKNAATNLWTTKEPPVCEQSTSKTDSSLKTGITANKNTKAPVIELETDRQCSFPSETENTTPFFESLTNKRPSSSDKGISAKKPTPSRMKPLPLAQVRNISSDGFLEKSQAPAVQSSKEDSQRYSNNDRAPVTRKRYRISILRESDDDEDDLFNFGDAKATQTAKKSRMSAVIDNDNSDDDLFRFKDTNQTKGRHTERTDEGGDEEDLIATEPLMPGFKSSASSYVVIKPKPLPREISLVGWLSCSTDDSGRCKIEDGNVMLKKEETSGNGNDDTAKTEEYTKWINTLTKGIEVRISALSVSSTKAPPSDEIDATRQQQNETLGNRKNFKAFVKKHNPHPQKRIIKLVPHCPNVK